MAKTTTYVGDFQISLMPMNLSGKLITVKRTGSDKEVALKSICPVCENATPVDQQYFCQDEAHHGPYKQGELSKAKEINKTLIKLSGSEVANAKESSLPINYLELSVYPAEEVETHTYPGSKSYIFSPKIANEQYGVMADIVANPKLAFIGTCNIKHIETLVRLVRWQDFIVVQQLLFPEDVNEAEELPIQYSPKFIEAMEKFTESQIAEFKPEDYKNNLKIKMSALTEAKESGTPIVIPEKNDDKLALEKLEAFLNQDKLVNV